MSFKKFIKDSPVNLPAVVVLAVGVVILIVYGYTSQPAKETSLFLHLVGTACYAAGIFAAIKVIKDDWEAGAWTAAAILFMFAAGVTLNVIQGV